MKMRKSFLALLLLTAACLALACPARAQTLTLPSSLKTIADEAFWHNTSITSAVVPDGAERIGARAFAGCTGLTEITLPATVTSIADDAFDGCTGLTIRCIEESYAAQYAAEHRIPVSIIEVIPEGLLYTVYDTYASITGYTGTATYLRIPGTIEGVPVTRIESFAFCDLQVLESIHLPDSIEVLESSAFCNCRELAEINYPIGLSLIDGDRTPFNSCPSLTRMVVPEGVTFIPDRCFEYCHSLTSISLPDSLQSIGEDSFFKCDGLSSIHLPDSVKTIGDYAFQRCRNLTEINYPMSITSIGYKAFSECDKLITLSIPEGVTSIPDYSFRFCTTLKNVTFPDSLRSIGECAFDGCDGLESVLLPDSIDTLGQYAFGDCANLTAINFPASLASIAGYDSPFWNCPKLTSITVPEGVTSIPAYAFNGCESLESIHLPNSLETFGNGAFANCDNLRDINYPINLSSYDGYYGPFAHTQLTSITIPEGVTSILAGIFEHCDSLISLSLPTSLLSIGNSAFSDCGNLRSLSLPKNLRSIGSFAFADCVSLQSVHLPDTVEILGEDAFIRCYNLTEINYPAKLSEISGRYSPFAGCSQLTSMVIPDGVKFIPADFFTEWDVSHIYIPASVEAIGQSIFPSNITVYGEEGSYAETFARSCNYSFRPYRDSGSITPPTLSLQNGAVLNTLTPTVVWNPQSDNEAYEVSLYELEDSGAETQLLNESQTASRMTLSLSFSKRYRLEVTASNPFGRATSESTFSTIAETGMPYVESFVMSDSAITVGSFTGFTVTARNATLIQLVVDGECYDEYAVVNDTASFSRIFTLSGERQVAFRAYGDGVWSAPCVAQTLSVTAKSTLAAPALTCPTKIRLGDALALSWPAVEHADGYTLYLNKPNGETDKIELKGGRLDYRFSADTFSETGSYNVLLMAYGKGYSQSSMRVYFTVTDEYETWIGWPQASKVSTYPSADSTTPNGYVDYIDPVTVLGEEGDCYLIEMTLTAGGTARRYVRKYAIGTKPYTPGLTMSASYTLTADGQTAQVQIKTNLVSCAAGITLNDYTVKTLYTPTSTALYTLIYQFEFVPPLGTTDYTVWAKDSDGNRIERSLTITRDDTSATATPVVTATPTALPTVSPTVSPDSSATPTPTASPTAIPTPTPTFTPTPTPTATPECSRLVNGVHQLDVVELDDMSLILRNDGRISIQEAACPQCGQHFSFGYVPDNVQMQFSYQSSLFGGSYDTSGNNGVYCTNSSYRSVIINSGLTVNKAIDLNGASLHVNGVLRVQSPMTNVGEINCSELIIENGGSLETVSDGAKIMVSGKLNVQANGTLNAAGSPISAGGDLVIDGTFMGGERLTCKNLSVGSNGLLWLQSGYTINTGDFRFASSRLHSCLSDASSVINTTGSIRISGTRFQYEGNCNLNGFKQSIRMDNRDVNYFAEVTLRDDSDAYALIDTDKKGAKLELSNWDPGNLFTTKKLNYRMLSSPASLLTQKILQGCFDVVIDASGIQGAIDIKNFITPILTNRMTVDEEEYRRLIIDSGESSVEVDPSTVITGDIGLTTFTIKTPQQKALVDNAVRFGLMSEMFIKRGTHNFKFKAFELLFSEIHGDSAVFSYAGDDWEMEIVGGIDMNITLNDVDLEDTGSTIFLSGSITRVTEGKLRLSETFSYTSSRSDLYKASLALRAAGVAEAVKELEKAADDVISAAQEALDMLIEFGYFDKEDFDLKQKLHNLIYRSEYTPAVIQKADKWVEGWTEYLKDEIETFKILKDYYDLSVQFYPVQP